MRYFIFFFNFIFVVLITITLAVASTFALALIVLSAILVLLKLFGDMIFKDARYWIRRSKLIKHQQLKIKSKGI